MSFPPTIRRVAMQATPPRIPREPPVGVQVACLVTTLVTAVGVYLVYLALVPIPRPQFPGPKPTMILVACLFVVVIGGGLQLGLLGGRLGAWFAAMNWAAIHAAVPALMLGR